MERKIQGYFETISTADEKAEAFIPNPLPPEPPIGWSPILRRKFDAALLALGRLDSVTTLLPNTSLFLYMYVRKEAVLSSQIEGTQSSLSDLLLFEIDQEPGVPIDDVQEVSNYVAALDHGLSRLAEDFPISLRLIKEIHGVLLAKGRGSMKQPGEFRTSQNWIGGTRPGNAVFVPPPAACVVEHMGHLELFLHDEPESTQILLKAALSHVQFETIHPFLDGNGRVGRLLITLLLCAEGVLQKPLLYLSLYFKTHKKRYYELLTAVRSRGDWEAWLEFFADAVIDTANGAVETARQLVDLSAGHEDQIKRLGRMAGSTLRVHRALLEHPITDAGRLVQATQLSTATVNKCLVVLQQLEIVREISAKKRNRLYAYSKYIEIINRGTEAASP